MSEERIARLETAMADLAEAMTELTSVATETRHDIRRLYEAWPGQFKQVTAAADHVRQRIGTAEVAIVREIQRIHERLDALEKKL